MVDGVLHCIGNKTHLKRKFGTGFEVTVRVADRAEDVARLEEFFARAFPASQLLETRAGRLTYELPATVRLSNVFTQLEANHGALCLMDYNVSQTSIEQVFLRISEEAERREEAELQEKMEKAKKRGCCCCC
ncbi:ABC transporter [Strigomonas culicis]|nr:ABC transporter [Strigomonas culicis]|eukprot:EPY29654.1 ABC transporter [Strigomonas culicis]